MFVWVDKGGHYWITSVIIRIEVFNILNSPIDISHTSFIFFRLFSLLDVVQSFFLDYLGFTILWFWLLHAYIELHYYSFLRSRFSDRLYFQWQVQMSLGWEQSFVARLASGGGLSLAVLILHSIQWHPSTSTSTLDNFQHPHVILTVSDTTILSCIFPTLLHLSTALDTHSHWLRRSRCRHELDRRPVTTGLWSSRY